MEHLQHFGLNRDPFASDPRPHAYVESEGHQQAERRVRRALAQKKALTLLLGAPGVGKTLLVRRLLEGLEEEVYDVSLLVPLQGIADTAWVLSRFAQQLEVDAPSPEPAGLLGQIYEKLAIIREDGRHAVLMIDEAHVLCSSSTLREVRGLLNLEYEDQRLLSLVLVGLPELEAAVARDPSLSGRVDLKVRMGGLAEHEAVTYLRERLESVGADPALFGDDALQALARSAAGRPRLLNTLADNALYEAFAAGDTAVGAGHVERAAQDLQGPGDAEAPPAPPPVRPATRVGEAAVTQLFSATPEPRPAAPLPPPSPADAGATRLFSEVGSAGGSSSSAESVFEGFGPSATYAAADSPPKEDDDDEIDDLFVELVDE